MSPNHHQSLSAAHTQGGVAEALMWKDWLWIQRCFYSPALIWSCVWRPSPQKRCWDTWYCTNHRAVSSFPLSWKDTFPCDIAQPSPHSTGLAHPCWKGGAIWSHITGAQEKSVREELFSSATPQSYGLSSFSSHFLYAHSWRVGMSKDTWTPYWEWILSSYWARKLLTHDWLTAWCLACNLDLNTLGNPNYWLASKSLISKAFMIPVFNQPCRRHEVPLNIVRGVPTVVLAWGFHARALKGDLWYELLEASSAPHNLWGPAWKGHLLSASLFHLSNLLNTCC